MFAAQKVAEAEGVELSRPVKTITVFKTDKRASASFHNWQVL